MKPRYQLAAVIDKQIYVYSSKPDITNEEIFLVKNFFSQFTHTKDIDNYLHACE